MGRGKTDDAAIPNLKKFYHERHESHEQSTKKVLKVRGVGAVSG
jgi:hypothetical protein